MARDPQFWNDALPDADNRRRAFRRISVKNRRRYANVDADPEDGGRVRLNMLYADIQNKRAMLQPPNVEVALLADDEDQEDRARVAQAVINSQFRDVDLVSEVAVMLQHLLLDGVAFGLVSWGVPMTPGVTPGEDPSDADQVDYNRDRTTVDRNAKIREWMSRAFPQYGLRHETPILSALDTLDVLIDPSVTRLVRARWYAIRHWMPRSMIEEAMDVGFFTKSDLRGQTPMTMESSRERWGEGVLATGNNSVHPEVQNAFGVSDGNGDDVWEFWEIRDRVTNQIHYHILGQEKFLRSEPYKLGIDLPMLVDLKTDYLPQTYWTPAESSQYLEVQTDLNATIEVVRDYMRRFSKTIIPVRNGQTTPDERNRVANAVNGEFVEMTNPDALKAINMGQLSPEYLQYITMMQNFITVMSGVSPVAQGLPSNPGASATEIATISRAFSVRMRRMQHALDRTLSRIAELFNRLNQVLLPKQYVIALVGSDVQHWNSNTLTVDKRDAIGGKHYVKIAAGAAGESEQELRKKQSLERYSLMVQNPHIDTRKLTEQTLRDFGDNPASLMVPEGAPAQAEQLGAEGAPGRGNAEALGAVSPDFNARVNDPELQAQLGAAQRA